jgi:RimJ/RimL family protein N-acetyltransferase
MNKDDYFESERLLFKGIDEQDAGSLVKWRSNPEVIKYFKNSKPASPEKHKDWFCNSYMKNDCRIDFIITEKSSMRKIGTAGAHNCDIGKGTCAVSCMIAEPGFQGRGYAREALSTLMEWVAQVGIRFFYAEIHERNSSSINMIKKLGFEATSQQGNFITYTKRDKR